MEAIEQKRREHLFGSPPRGPKNRLLGPSWAALGARLGALGAVLGLFWASLGAVLGHLGAILRPQEPIGSEKARRQKTLFFSNVFEGFWPLEGLLGRLLDDLEPSWGGAGASWRHVVSELKPCWAILSYLRSHLERSEALWEPSWAKKGALTARGTLPPGPGEGGGEGVNPSPKGKKGVGRREDGRAKSLTP